jgi:flagellar M-ring protein FliF
MAPEQRRRLAVLLGLVGTAAIALVIWALRPTYQVLYSELSPQDASALADYLRDKKIPYRLVAQGTAIEVPQDQVYELRLKTAGEGLLASGTVGLEIFDRSTLPGTDFANRVNLQRALQGELSRTVASLSEVSSARVHLVMPEKSLFGEEKPAQASVMVNLRGGKTLSAEQVHGIQMLVAKAVEGLKPEEVVIVDQHGTVLGGGEGQEMLTAAQLEAKAKYESLMCQRLQQMMDAFVGPNKSVVQVEAQMIYDSEEVNMEQVQPLKTPGGAIRREHVTKEDYVGGGSAAGGPAGASANVLGQRGGSLPRASGQYTHIEETREYEFSRTTTRTVRPPGKVARVSVAVLVDESVPASTNTIASVLQAAIGFDSRRGDVIEVRKVPLEATKLAETQLKEAEKEAAAQRRGEIMRQASRYLGGLALAVVLGAFLLTASRHMKAAMQKVAGESEREAARGEETRPSLPEGAEGRAPHIGRTERRAAEGPTEVLEDTLVRLARENSPAFASQLRLLIGQGGQDHQRAEGRGGGSAGSNGTGETGGLRQ